MSWNNIIKGLYLDIDMIFNIPQEIVAGHSLLYMYISILQYLTIMSFGKIN